MDKRRKIPYSKMPLAKLKEIEATIIIKDPGLESRKSEYHEEEKNLAELRENIEGIRNRIAEIRSSAINRHQQEYAAAGTLKKAFTRPDSQLTEPEIAEINQLKEQMFKLSYRYDSLQYSSEHEQHKKLTRIKTIISEKEKKGLKKKTDP